MMDYENHRNVLRKKLSSLGPVVPSAWDAIASRVEWLHCRRDRSLPTCEGDLLYLFEGLLKEELDDGRSLSIQQFIRAGDFFIAPRNLHSSQFVALESATAAKISQRGLYELNRLFPELSAVYEQVIAATHQQLIQRISLLLLPKRDRYAAFQRAFPGLAAHLLDKDVMAYLDISPSYFSHNK